MSALGALALFAAGVVASVFGSIVGLGGGFLAVPVLRIPFGLDPAHTAGTSLVMVLANAAAASHGYVRAKMADVPLAVLLTIGAVPGSIAGALVVSRFSASTFDVTYGVLLLVLAVLVIRRRRIASRAHGERTFAHAPPVAIAAGVGVGLVSSLFGIGGGLLLIPLLLIAARMPPHVVTATSSVVIMTTAPIGVVAHALAGHVDWAFAIPLALGAVTGGSIGPRIARRVSSPNLITLLAIGLILAALGLAGRHIVGAG